MHKRDLSGNNRIPSKFYYGIIANINFLTSISFLRLYLLKILIKNAFHFHDNKNFDIHYIMVEFGLDILHSKFY